MRIDKAGRMDRAGFRDRFSYDRNPPKLGDVLRGERMSLGKSLEDVEQDLRIRSVYIDAIERHDSAVLPGRAWLTGYVRSYAVYLKMDPEETLSRFLACDPAGAGKPLKAANSNDAFAGKAKAGAAKAARAKYASAPKRARKTLPSSLIQPLSRRRKGGFPKLTNVVILGLLVFIGAGVAWGGVLVFRNIQMTAAVSPDALPFDLSASGTSSPFPPQRNDPYGVADPSIPTRESGEAGGSGEAAPVPEPDIRPVIAAAPPALRVAVRILALAPAWVHITDAGGATLFVDTMRAGESYDVPSDAASPVMRTGNAGGVYVDVGDSRLGPFGRLGAVMKSISLAPESLRTRFSAH